MKILEQLKQRQQSNRQQAAKTIREIAKRAAEDNPRKDDGENLYRALAEAGMSVEQFEAMAEDLRQLEDLRREAGSIERIEHELGEAHQAIVAHEAETAQIIKDRKAEKDELDAKRRGLDSELRRARKAASAAEAIEAKHRGWIEPENSDLDGYTLACRENLTDWNVKGAPRLDVSVGTLRRENEKRWACIQAAWLEDVKNGAMARREWERKNDRQLNEIGTLQRQNEEAAMHGMSNPATSEAIRNLQAKLSSAPPRIHEINMPEWGDLVHDRKRLDAIKAQIASDIGVQSIEQATVEQLHEAAREYENTRSGNKWKAA